MAQRKTAADRGNAARFPVIGGPLNLQIVWRNPQSRLTPKLRVEQVVQDAYGALYAVRRSDQVTVFELIVNRAA